MAKRKSDDGGGAAVAEPPKPASSLDMTDADMKSIGQEATRLARAAESIFSKLADGSDLSDDELATLRRAGPQVIPRDGGRSGRAFDRWLSAEKNRILTVRKLQGTAGGSADRKAASEAAEQAESVFTTRSKEIAKLIAELQAERSELETRATAARAASDRRRVAVAKLRQKSRLPVYVGDRLRQTERRWSGGPGHELEADRNRLRILEGLGQLDVSERKSAIGGPVGGEGLQTVQSFIEGCALFGRTTDERLAHFGMLHKWVDGSFHGHEIRPNELDRVKWAAYLRDSVQPEIERLQQEIGRLAKLEAEHFATMEALADYYVPA